MEEDRQGHTETYIIRGLLSPAEMRVVIAWEGAHVFEGCSDELDIKLQIV